MVSEKHDELTHKTKQMQFLAEALHDGSESSEGEDHKCEEDGKTDNDAMTEMTENQCKCTKKEKKFKKLPL